MCRHQTDVLRETNEYIVCSGHSDILVYSGRRDTLVHSGDSNIFVHSGDSDILVHRIAVRMRNEVVVTAT